MIEATSEQLVLIRSRFKENGISDKAIWVQALGGKIFVEVISTAIGGKCSIANNIIKEVIWPSGKNTSAQAE